MRKPVHVSAEGHDLKNRRGDKTPLELFIAGIRVWQSWFAVYVSWGICSITHQKKSVMGCSIPNRLSLEAF